MRQKSQCLQVCVLSHAGNKLLMGLCRYESPVVLVRNETAVALAGLSNVKATCACWIGGQGICFAVGYSSSDICIWGLPKPVQQGECLHVRCSGLHLVMTVQHLALVAKHPCKRPCCPFVSSREEESAQPPAQHNSNHLMYFCLPQLHLQDGKDLAASLYLQRMLTVDSHGMRNPVIAYHSKSEPDRLHFRA